jgi:hypothetical protein
MAEALQKADTIVFKDQKPEPPKAKVFLLTNYTCLSACLDFADAVRSIPGATHIGSPTRADAGATVMGVVAHQGMSALRSPALHFSRRKGTEFRISIGLRAN